MLFFYFRIFFVSFVQKISLVFWCYLINFLEFIPTKLKPVAFLVIIWVSFNFRISLSRLVALVLLIICRGLARDTFLLMINLKWSIVVNINCSMLSILYYDFNASYNKLLSKGGWPGMNVNRLRALCVEIYKIINDLSASF